MNKTIRFPILLAVSYLAVAFACPVRTGGQEAKPDTVYTEVPKGLVGYDASVHVHISDDAEAMAVRQQVIDFLWPDGGLPVGKLPVGTSVYKGEGPFPAELAGLTEALVAQVEKIDAQVDFDYHHLSYLAHPADPKNADRLVIIHQGHQGELKDGVGDLADHLLARGFTVLLMQMPLVGWNTDNTFDLPGGMVTIGGRSVGGHNQMFPALEGKGGSTLRFFIEPVVAGINYFLRQQPKCRDICMVGLSGGGWTTHVAAALDSRIKLSIPVAGAYPLYLQEHYPGSKGDTEQILPALYQDRASWLDLYILSGYGKGRRQIQVLNQFDTCCFFGIGSQTYEAVVSDAVKKLGAGQWECVIDSSHQSHKISKWAVENVIDPALGAGG
jgi:dienelactone hydrolase